MRSHNEQRQEGMRKAEIVRRIAVETDLTQVKAEEAINAIFDEIKSALEQGDSVILRRFGSFQVRDKSSRTGRNPKTGEAAEISPRRVVRFKSGNHFKDAVNESTSEAPKDWKKSITKHTIECLVCGATFKQLSIRHLRHHDLDPHTYRQQFGIPRTQPLSAKETTAMRKRVVQETRPRERAPTDIKSKEEQAPPPPARPKRARKKTSTR